MTVERQLDPIKGKPFPVDHINSLGSPAAAPAGMLVDLVFRGLSEAVRPEISSSRNMRPASTTVTMERQEFLFNGTTETAIKWRKKFVPSITLAVKGGVQVSDTEVLRCPTRTQCRAEDRAVKRRTKGFGVMVPKPNTQARESPIGDEDIGSPAPVRFGLWRQTEPEEATPGGEFLLITVLWFQAFNIVPIEIKAFRGPESPQPEGEVGKAG
ncbi:unnamed protein product [Cylindrotheca closterium]|uniref:Uncharacterized protein n=1 Tax=Cylindrotheca closterium TaxID=2856 RepID=A0AAD2G994_9STRA|nr:unnamed protein product [Cylindrotheca closterium]